jgi:hypothetical protein
MTSETAMSTVIRCDVHKKSSVFLAIESQDLASSQVEHHRQMYIDFLHTLPPESEIAQEATGH